MQSLLNGVIADENINCHNVEKIGLNLHMKMDNIAISNATLKRKEQVKNLASLKNTVRNQNETINIDPALLFSY